MLKPYDLHDITSIHTFIKDSRCTSSHSKYYRTLIISPLSDEIMVNNNEAEGKLNAILTVVVDAIGASAIEEKLLIPARLQKARNEAFNEGYTARDKELQKIIRESEHERELFKNENRNLARQIESLNQQLAAKDQDIAKLKLEKDKLKAGQKQLKAHA